MTDCGQDIVFRLRADADRHRDAAGDVDSGVVDAVLRSYAANCTEAADEIMSLRKQVAHICGRIEEFLRSI